MNPDGIAAVGVEYQYLLFCEQRNAVRRLAICVVRPGALGLN